MSELVYKELRKIIDTELIEIVEIKTRKENKEYKFKTTAVMGDKEEIDIYTDKQDYTIKIKDIQAIKFIEERILKIRIENECQIEGLYLESLDKNVKSHGNSGRVNVPVSWVGKRVKVVLPEPL